jgi:hypothetical protein
LFVGCGDATGPDPELQVKVTLSTFSGPAYGSNPAGEATVNCGFGLTAVATGEGTATWGSATYRVFIGGDRSAPVDTVILEASDIADSWDSPQITAGQNQTASWEVSSGIPFAAAFEFRYSAHGKTKSTKVDFDCSPPISTTAAPPLVTALTVVPPSGELPAGAPLTVSYAAEAGNGLWQTRVRINGPCEVEQLFPEQAKTSTSHSLSIRLPASCQLGLPIIIIVDAWDIAGKNVRRVLTTPLVIADRAKPQIFAMFAPPGGGSYTTVAGGDYFAGDSIRVLLSASDNHALAALVWEVLPSGERDSVLVSGAGASMNLGVKIGPDVTGPIQLRFFARDAVGLTSDTIVTPVDSLRVHPSIERPTRTGTVSGETREVAFDERRGVLYLAQGNDHRIAIVSTQTLQIISTLALPAVPLDLDMSDGGDSLFVVLAQRAELGVIDLRQPTLSLSTLPLTAISSTRGQAPIQVRVGSNGHAFVTVSGSDAAGRVMLDVDLAGGEQRTLTAAGASGDVGIGILERSLDRSVLVLTTATQNCGVQRYVVASNNFSACKLPRVSDVRASVSRTGDRVALGFDVYDASLRLLPKANTQFSGGVPRSALSADGNSLFIVNWPHGLVRLSASDGTILDRTLNPITASFIRVSPDGTMLLTLDSNYGTQTRISLIDLR